MDIVGNGESVPRLKVQDLAPAFISFMSCVCGSRIFWPSHVEVEIEPLTSYRFETCRRWGLLRQFRSHEELAVALTSRKLRIARRRSVQVPPFPDRLTRRHDVWLLSPYHDVDALAVVLAFGCTAACRVDGMFPTSPTKLCGDRFRRSVPCWCAIKVDINLSP